MRRHRGDSVRQLTWRFESNTHSNFLQHSIHVRNQEYWNCFAIFAKKILTSTYVYKGNGVPNGPRNLTVSGLEATVVYINTLFSAIPDLVIDLRKATMHTTPTNFSQIQCQFVFTGTKVLSIIDIDKHKTDKISISGGRGVPNSSSSQISNSKAVSYSLRSKVRHPSSSSSCSSTSSISSIDGDAPTAHAAAPVMLAAHGQQFSVGLVPKTVKISCCGLVTFFVKPNDKISKFNFLYSETENKSS